MIPFTLAEILQDELKRAKIKHNEASSHKENIPDVAIKSEMLQKEMKTNACDDFLCKEQNEVQQSITLPLFGNNLL